MVNPFGTAFIVPGFKDNKLTVIIKLFIELIVICFGYNQLNYLLILGGCQVHSFDNVNLLLSHKPRACRAIVC